VNLNRIDHFVVLMLENRSFDHMFGLRAGVDGLPAGGFSNTAGGKKFKTQGGAPFAIPTKHGLGPFHNFTDRNVQIFGADPPPANAQPTMSGFAANYVRALTSDTHGQFGDQDVEVVMQSFDNGALPSMTALADEFVLCDRWHCEVPGPTHPNRLYVHAGTSAGFVHNVFSRPFDNVTIYELLERNGQTWATYDFDLNEVRMFTRLAQNADRFRKFSPQFAQDVETGQLPNYSFILPRFSSSHHAASNDQHAPHDVRYGDQLIADVYDTLAGSDDVWNKCALVVTYDEDGGFFDHAPPPAATPPDQWTSPRSDDNFHGAPPPPFNFDRLGIRVPALVASPWVPKGHVESGLLQHTSILRTVRERFKITTALGERERKARTLASLFSRKTARTDCPKHLPRATTPTLPPADHHANLGNAYPNELQREMLEGLIRATRASHPDDDRVPPATPRNQHDLSVLANRRVSNHARWTRV
jgi:phospholipase C